MPGTANSIITPQAVRAQACVCTAAKTTYNDATNAQDLVTAGPSGAVVYRITALARATVAPTQLQLYRVTGGVWHLIGVTVMGAYTLTQATAQTPADFGLTETSPLRLNPGEKLAAGIGVALAAGIVFDAQYEDL